MKTTFLGLLLLITTVISAQEQARIPQPANAPRYSEETGYGHDPVSTPEKESKTPFFPSIRVPDGNYKITICLGNRKQAGVITVRGESCRLSIDDLPTRKGQLAEETLIIDRRNPHVSDKESIRIESREKTKPNWGDKLTLGFNGDAPVCQSINTEPADLSIVTAFLCGNNTVVDQDNGPWASWEQMIPHFFGADVCIANYVESDESANTLIGAKRLAKALNQIKKGDYLFMEFGHNDQRQKGSGKGAYYSFMTSLKTFIDGAHAREAHPVSVTPTQRRSFDANGHIRDTHEGYPEAIYWLAAKENVPSIDLNEMTRTLCGALGPSIPKRASVHYPAGTCLRQARDLANNTHFNPYGVYQIAQCVIEGMKETVPELAEHLKIDPAHDPAHPDDVNTLHWNDSPFTEIEKSDGN